MATLRKAHSKKIRRYFTERIWGKRNDTENILKIDVLEVRLDMAISENFGMWESHQRETEDDRADRMDDREISMEIVESVVRDIAMALTGREWDPRRS